MKSVLQSLDGRLIQKARLLEEITRRVRSRLPSQIASHCWVCGYEQHKLLILADSGSCATMIRCHQHEMLKLINAEFADLIGNRLKAATVRVAPPA